MKFALFYEIPVPKPFTPGKEHQAYKNTLEQAILGDEVGFHAFWTVEHHFLEEYSHCSNPEVLYGAIAARTKNIRIGYGVRLLPQPYNHPIRSAESAAVLDLLSDGRVDFGTGRSSTRLELEGFDVDPDETREMWQRGARSHRRRVDRGALPGRRASTGTWARRAACSRSRCSSRTRRSSARRASREGHEEVGRQGIGLCSFTVGLPPEELVEQHRPLPQGSVRVRRARRQVQATRPRRRSRWCTARRRRTRRTRVAEESFEWYPKAGARLIASVAEWLEEQAAGARHLRVHRQARCQHDRDGALDHLTFDFIHDAGAGVVGDPGGVHRDAASATRPRAATCCSAW